MWTWFWSNFGLFRVPGFLQLPYLWTDPHVTIFGSQQWLPIMTFYDIQNLLYFFFLPIRLGNYRFAKIYFTVLLISNYDFLWHSKLSLFFLPAYTDRKLSFRKNFCHGSAVCVCWSACYTFLGHLWKHGCINIDEIRNLGVIWHAKDRIKIWDKWL